MQDEKTKMKTRIRGPRIKRVLAEIPRQRKSSGEPYASDNCPKGGEAFWELIGIEENPIPNEAADHEPDTYRCFIWRERLPQGHLAQYKLEQARFRAARRVRELTDVLEHAQQNLAQWDAYHDLLQQLTPGDTLPEAPN